MEKMVNMKAVLESNHALPLTSSTPGFIKFDPVEFLVKTQKVPFSFCIFNSPLVFINNIDLMALLVIRNSLYLYFIECRVFCQS